MFDGEIRGIRIYSRALTHIEIARIYSLERKLYFKWWERWIYKLKKLLGRIRRIKTWQNPS